MARITIVYAALLIILGVAGYFATGQASVTALIPSFFGLVFLGLGLMALKEKLRKHAMHGASLLALLALAGTGGGVLRTVQLLQGAEVARPAAQIAQAIMFLLTAVFLGLCIKSFIDARIARKREAQP